MPSAKKIRWTPLQLEVKGLIDQGKTFNELIELGYGNDTVSKVTNAIKKGDLPKVEVPSDNKNDGNGSNPPAKGSSRGGLEIGKIVITPENWAMSQYGAVLILDTYTHAKNDEEFKYEGTVGQFICDVMLLWRRMMGYEEVYYDSRKEESGWTGSSPEDAGEDGGEQKLVESAV